MRIKEDFKKSGYFWLPSSPDKKFPGTLSISDGGIIDLEIIELFESIDSDNLDGESGFSDVLNWYPAFRNRFKRIVGRLETGEVTLDDCEPNGGYQSFRTGFSKSLLRVDRAFTGVKYDKDEIPRFKILIFSVDGINDWMGINFDHSNPPDPNYPRVYQRSPISFQHPEPVSFNLPNGMELSITFNQESSGSMSPREDRITQRTYFELVSQDARELDDFISIVEKIINFLCFAMGNIVCFDSMEASSKNPPPFRLSREDRGYNEIGLLPINIFYSSQFYSKDKRGIGFDSLFKFEQIKNDAERVICNWIDAYEQTDPAFNLYFLAKMGAQPSLEATFLTLATGLEAYHRRTSDEKQMDETEFDELVENLIEQCPDERKKWLRDRLRHGNEVSLRRRITRLIEPFKDLFGNNKKRKKLINGIVNTRNDLTHPDSKPEDVEDLRVLCQKMEALFQLHLLQLIGFSQEDINSIVDHQLIWKLQL